MTRNNAWLLSACIFALSGAMHATYADGMEGGIGKNAAVKSGAEDAASSRSGSSVELQNLSNDGRIQFVKYDPNEIFTITTRVGYQTNLEFSENEEVEMISIGERSFWQIIPSGNRIFIRPLQDDVATNMTIITNRHSYQFDLQSVSSKQRKIMYVVRFEYPNAKRKVEGYMDPFLNTVVTVPANNPAVAAAPTVPVTVTAPTALPDPAPLPVSTVNAAPRNYLYTFAGPESGAPFEVFDDGRSTYFRYRGTLSSIPQASLVIGGSETPVILKEFNGYYVADAVAAQWVLRSSVGISSVFNETLTVQ